MTLASLFISGAYQGLKLGSQAMSLLEQAAIEAHGAKAILVVTRAYQCVRPDPTDDSFWVELPGQEARNVAWYRRRGYVPYGVSGVSEGLMRMG